MNKILKYGQLSAFQGKSLDFRTAEAGGAEYMDTSDDKKQTHWIQDFTNQIQNLPEGKYKIENGKIVPY